MSNLSFARIMYGTNENPETYHGIYAKPLSSHPSIAIAGVTCTAGKLGAQDSPLRAPKPLLAIL